MKRILASLVAFMLSSYLGTSQTNLTARQIMSGEALGRTTYHSLKFGTLASVKGDGFQAFVLSPVQRIAYTTSEEASTHHKDILKDELHLNRLRVSMTSFDQHHSRAVVLYDSQSKRKLEPARLVLDLDQAIAEFDMPDVIALSRPSGSILIQVSDEVGVIQPPIPFLLKSLDKRYPKFENEFF